MRIGVITHTTAGRGGIERVVEQQVAGLRARGHEVDLVAGPALGSGWLARAGSAGLLAFDTGRRLRGCDVVLAHYQPGPLVAARSGRPYAVYLHHPLRAAHPTAVQRGRLRFRAWGTVGAGLAGVDRRSVRGARLVAVPSPSVQAEAREVYGRDAVLLPLGVDTELFRPGSGAAGPLLFVGRPDERYKRLDWAIEVARRLGRPLHVVGETRARAEGEIVWHGYLTGVDLVEAYRSAELLLFPSMREDFGLVPLEAMACGLPVIAWDDGHGPSTTLRAGSAGVLVPAYDIDAFTAAAARVLEDEATRNRLRQQGPEWVRRHYSIDHHIDRLVVLLTDVVTRGEAA